MFPLFPRLEKVSTKFRFPCAVVTLDKLTPIQRQWETVLVSVFVQYEHIRPILTASVSVQFRCRKA